MSKGKGKEIVPLDLLKGKDVKSLIADFPLLWYNSHREKIVS